MNFFEEIKRRIDNNALCTVLSVPDKLPWHEQLLEILVNEWINDEFSGMKKFLIIDDAEVKNDIGALLYEKYADEKQQSKYKYSVKKPAYDDFLIQEGILDDKIIWVKNVSNVDRWKKRLFPKYSGKTSGNSVIFILETTNGGAAGSDETLKYFDYVTVYDVNLFASLAAEESAAEPKLRQYITFVAANLCAFDMNVESMAKFISEKGGDFKSMNIVDAFTSGGYMAKDDDRNRVERRLWRAQLQAAFPLIEEERVKFIDDPDHFESLLTAMEVSEKVDLEGVNDPYDLELGKIVFMLDEGSLRVHGPKKRIRLLHKLRNRLAHWKVCDADDMYELLSAGAETPNAPA